MTRLCCVCGAVIEGSEEELLDAVERHLADAHSDEVSVEAVRDAMDRAELSSTTAVTTLTTTDRERQT